MSLNCNEINLILQELDLPGSFIQEIVQPGYDTLSFRIINKGKSENLLICTGASACRMNRTRSKAPKNDKPLRFNEFLRSTIRGMRINECRQLGLDRIIRFDLSTWKDRCFMYVRLWSGAANVIVTDTEGKILDCMFRRPKKGEVTGGTFLPEEKIPSEEERAAALERFPVRSFDDLPGQRPTAPGLSFNEQIDLF